MFASFRGNIQLVKEFLKRKANIHLKDKYGSTALMFAAHKGRDSIISLLLKRGAKINEKDDNGATPLSLATVGNHVSTVKLLLKNKAVIGVIEYKGNPEIVELLMDKQLGAIIK